MDGTIHRFFEFRSSLLLTVVAADETHARVVATLAQLAHEPAFVAQERLVGLRSPVHAACAPARATDRRAAVQAPGGDMPFIPLFQKNIYTLPPLPPGTNATVGSGKRNDRDIESNGYIKERKKKDLLVAEPNKKHNEIKIIKSRK